MLRNIYAPTDFGSTDMEPSLSSHEKLAIIAHSTAVFEPDVIRGQVNEKGGVVRLPYTDGVVINFGLKSLPGMLITEHVNIGDKALYGQGLGTRLVRAACRYAVERDKQVRLFTTGWARLGLVNTAVSVFGEENVAVIQGRSERFGWEGTAPLEAVFDKYPPETDKKYLVWGISARIDRDQAMTWEQPIVADLASAVVAPK